MMKRTLTSTAWLLLGASLLGSHGLKGEDDSRPTPAPTPASGKRPTSESIIDTRKQRNKENEARETSESQNPIKKSKRADSPRGKSIRRSTFLGSGNAWARIPAGSVIYIPIHLKQKIIKKPHGKVLRWRDFHKKNHGWIYLHPVNIQQARGLEIIQPDVIKAYQSMGKLVVAAYQGAPISVIQKTPTPERIN